MRRLKTMTNGFRKKWDNLNNISMKLTETRKHLIYALLSFVSPIAAFLIILAYQSIAHAQDWEDIGQDAGMAGAFLGLGEIIQIAFAILIGTIVGLIFGVLSFRKRRILGLVVLIFNGVPFLTLSFLIIRGMTRGW